MVYVSKDSPFRMAGFSGALLTPGVQLVNFP